MAGFVRLWWCLLAACCVAMSSLPQRTEAAEEIPLGTILSLWDDYKEVFAAMQFALEQQHNHTNKLFQFKLYADNIKTVDAYKLTKIVCRQVGVHNSLIRQNKQFPLFHLVSWVAPSTLSTKVNGTLSVPHSQTR